MDAAKPYCIVVAEDDEDDCHLLRLLFEQHYPQCCLCFFERGDLLQEHLSQEPRTPADLLIPDQNMPGLSGLETLRNLRADVSAWGLVPAVMLTTSASEQDRERFLGAGGQAFFTKPTQLQHWRKVLSQMEIFWQSPAPRGR